MRKKMDCIYCKSEWIADEQYLNKLTECPFCGKKLVSKPNSNEISDCFRFIIDKYGKNILTDGKQFYALLTDLIPSKEKELKAIKIVCTSKVLADFNDISVDDYNELVKRTVKVLVDDYMMAESWASKVIGWLGDSLGYTLQVEVEETEEATTIVETTVEPPKPKAKPQSTNNTTIDEFELGKKYYHGTDVVQDFDEAFKHFMIAAKAGNVEAMTWVGLGYFYGEGTSKNKMEAEKWFRKASSKGNTDAEYMIKKYF